jgi:peptidoglycan/xylan/chitin deacetylase (PgdA/CDA1 family)
VKAGCDGMKRWHASFKMLMSRGLWKYRRMTAKRLCRRMITIKAAFPIVSFSFDDAPRSAFSHGGEILNAYDAKGTFYVCLGMLGGESASGPIASLEDLSRAVKAGHELGCHTFDHKNSWETKPDEFVKSVLRNREVLSEILRETAFKTFAYPICNPRPRTKRKIGELFSCCRGGGQTFNVGKTDLNLLKAFFVDVRNGYTAGAVKRVVDKNTEVKGWLIFATHDISDNPSRYGCSKRFFMEVVRHAAQSGALLLPVGEACEHLQMQGNKGDRKPQM